MPGFMVDSSAATALLLMALVLPVVLFWLLRSRVRLRGMIAAAIAVAAGWALNVAWALVAARDAAQEGDTVAIAAGFGWLCPSVLVLLTWLAWHFAARRMNRGPSRAP